MSLVSVIGRAIGATPGVVLGGASLVTAMLRGSKPLHPIGVAGEGVLIAGGQSPADAPSSAAPLSGVPILDEPGEHPVFVRWSRALGRDAGESDIEGLAMRLGDQGRFSDLLFASTGSGVLGRHVLALRGAGEFGTLTTLLPVETDEGSLILALEPAAPAGGPQSPPTAYRLLWSHVGGDWHEVGELRIAWRREDTATRFDPILHQLAGTRQYGVVVALREPAYWAARRQRPEPRTPQVRPD
jgi:hypothetical protein